MGAIGILLLVGGALAGLMGLGGLDVPDLDEDALRRASEQDKDEDDLLLTGEDGADILTGKSGNDWMIGLDEDDTLDGAAGDDVLIPGKGADVVAAGTGDDFVEAANVVDEAALRASASGADDIFDIDFSYDLPQASDAADVIDLGDGDDTVVAGSGDAITGGAGSDAFSLGDWIEGGTPVQIADFDESDDILTFVYDKEGNMPELSVDVNETTGITTIKADGAAIAVLRDTSPDFSVRNIAMGRYAA